MRCKASAARTAVDGEKPVPTAVPPAADRVGPLIERPIRHTSPPPLAPPHTPEFGAGDALLLVWLPPFATKEPLPETVAPEITTRTPPVPVSAEPPIRVGLGLPTPPSPPPAAAPPDPPLLPPAPAGPVAAWKKSAKAPPPAPPLNAVPLAPVPLPHALFAELWAPLPPPPPPPVIRVEPADCPAFPFVQLVVTAVPPAPPAAAMVGLLTPLNVPVAMRIALAVVAPALSPVPLWLAPRRLIEIVPFTARLPVQ